MIKDGFEFDTIISVDRNGDACFEDWPDEVTSFLEYEGFGLEQDGIEQEDIPTEPGLYRMKWRYWFSPGFCDGYHDPSGDEFGLALVDQELVLKYRPLIPRDEDIDQPDSDPDAPLRDDVEWLGEPGEPQPSDITGWRIDGPKD